jgi:hypothetical protein
MAADMCLYTPEVNSGRQKASDALRSTATRLEARAQGLRAIADALEASADASSFCVHSPAEIALWNLALSIR